MIEINFNLTSMRFDIDKVSPQALVVEKERDVKIDLFYLSLFHDIKLIPGESSPDASFVGK